MTIESIGRENSPGRLWENYIFFKTSHLEEYLHLLVRVSPTTGESHVLLPEEMRFIDQLLTIEREADPFGNLSPDSFKKNFLRRAALVSSSTAPSKATSLDLENISGLLQPLKIVTGDATGIARLKLEMSLIVNLICNPSFPLNSSWLKKPSVAEEDIIKASRIIGRTKKSQRPDALRRYAEELILERPQLTEYLSPDPIKPKEPLVKYLTALIGDTITHDLPDPFLLSGTQSDRIKMLAKYSLTEKPKLKDMFLEVVEKEARGKNRYLSLISEVRHNEALFSHASAKENVLLLLNYLDSSDIYYLGKLISLMKTLEVTYDFDRNIFVSNAAQPNLKSTFKAFAALVEKRLPYDSEAVALLEEIMLLREIPRYFGEDHSELLKPDLSKTEALEQYSGDVSQLIRDYWIARRRFSDTWEEDNEEEKTGQNLLFLASKIAYGLALRHGSLPKGPGGFLVGSHPKGIWKSPQVSNVLDKDIRSIWYYGVDEAAKFVKEITRVRLAILPQALDMGGKPLNESLIERVVEDYEKIVSRLYGPFGSKLKFITNALDNSIKF